MDPLTVRELRGLSRRGPLYLGRGLYVGLAVVVLYLWWFSQFDRFDRFRTLSPSEYANLGRRLFTSLTVLQVTLVALGATIGAADMISRELRSRTLSLLFVSPLSGLQIVWAKWKASMAQAVTLMLCGLPVLAVCSYLGAIGIRELFWSISLTLAMASLGAALGLRQALRCKSAGGATLMALAEFALPILVLTPFAGTFDTIAVLLIYLHPAGALVGALQPGMLGGTSSSGWMSATVASFALSAWLIRRTGRNLLETSFTVEEPDPDLTEERGLLAPGAAVRSWITETRVWDDHPLLWKELATRPGVRLERYLGSPLLWGTLAVLVVMWVGTGGVSLPFLVFVEALVLVALVVLGSGRFTRDRETRWYELILCSPLSTSELLRAKLVAGLVAPESRYVLGVGIVVLLGWTLPLGFLLSLFAVLTAASFALFAYLLAAFSSLHCRSIRGAFIVAAGILLLVFLLLPYHSVWVDARSVFGSNSPGMLRFYASSLNPVIFLPSGEGYQWRDLNPGRPFLSMICCVLYYLAASGLLLTLTGWTFHRMRCPR